MATSDDPDLFRLQRFLCFGQENGIYNSNSPHSTFLLTDVNCIERLLLNGRGNDILQCIKDVSCGNKACRQTPVLYAFAFCTKFGDREMKKKAYEMLRDICRVPTHLFQFVKFSKDLSTKREGKTGWGRCHRVGIGRWYNSFANNARQLAYHVTKYRKRHSWSHRDVIRLAHVKPQNEKIRTILKYVLGKDREEIVALHDSVDKELKEVQTLLRAVTDAKHCTDKFRLCELIADHELSREHVPIELLKEKEVWTVLIRTMPLMAMLRNLGKMTKLGIFDDENASFFVELVEKKLSKEGLQKARVHPLALLSALNQYSKGKGHQGKLTWKQNGDIIKILDKAFYESIQLLPVSGKRYLLAVSVSDEMQKPLIGSPLSASEAAAAMVLSIIKQEPQVKTLLFTHSGHSFVSNIDKYDNMNSIKGKIQSITERSSNETLNSWVKEHENKYDVFIVFTDSLAYEGSRVLEMFDSVTPCIGAVNHKRIIVAMTSKRNEVPEPRDTNTLHVIGFDPMTPKIIRTFIDQFESPDYESMEGVQQYC